MRERAGGGRRGKGGRECRATESESERDHPRKSLSKERKKGITIPERAAASALADTHAGIEQHRATEAAAAAAARQQQQRRRTAGVASQVEDHGPQLFLRRGCLQLIQRIDHFLLGIHSEAPDLHVRQPVRRRPDHGGEGDVAQSDLLPLDDGIKLRRHAVALECDLDLGARGSSQHVGDIAEVLARKGHVVYRHHVVARCPRALVSGQIV